MNRIKTLREAKGLSQKALAIDLKVTQPTISAWENGSKLMSNQSAACVADYFGVSMDYLLGRSDGDPKNTKQPIDDDGLRAQAIEKVQTLSDPALVRVLDFLDGLSAGQEIGAAVPTDRDPD